MPSQHAIFNLDLGTDIFQTILGIISAIKVKAFMAGNKFDDFEIWRIRSQNFEAAQGKAGITEVRRQASRKAVPVPSPSSICLSRMYLMSASISGMINLQIAGVISQTAVQGGLHHHQIAIYGSAD